MCRDCVCAHWSPFQAGRGEAQREGGKTATESSRASKNRHRQVEMPAEWRLLCLVSLHSRIWYIWSSDLYRDVREAVEFWGVLGLFLFLSTLFPGSDWDDFMERKPNNSALYQHYIFIVIKSWVKKNKETYWPSLKLCHLKMENCLEQ